MSGSVGILNVGAGDTKLVFDPTKPGESARSAQIVKDMIRRGFVLLIEVGRNEKGPIYQRAHDFDEGTHEYIVAGMANDASEKDSDEQKPSGKKARVRKATPRHSTKKPQRVPARSTNAIAVARTAGG